MGKSSRVFWIQGDYPSVTLTTSQVANLKLQYPDLTFTRVLTAFDKSSIDALVHIPVNGIIAALSALFTETSFQLDQNLQDVAAMSAKLASSLGTTGVSADSFDRTKVQALLSSDGSNNFIGSAVFAARTTGAALPLAEYIRQELDDPIRLNGVTAADATNAASTKEYLFVDGDVLQILVGVSLPSKEELKISYAVQISPPQQLVSQ
jgi:hypothetical protein